MCRVWWGAALQRMIKQRCNRELNTLLSCGCLISGVSHRRHRNRVNANETWWKASPWVAQPVRTSSDYCTINLPSVNASAFIIRSPIRQPNLCSPSHKLQIIKRTQESVMQKQCTVTHGEVKKCVVKRKCFVGCVFLAPTHEYFKVPLRIIDLFNRPKLAERTKWLF